MIKRYTIALFIFCAFLVSGVQAEPKIGDRAPRITAAKWWNLPSTLKKLEMTDLKDRVVIVEFWATWCGPCRASVPHLTKIYDKYKAKGVVLVALSYEKGKFVGDYVKAMNIPYIVGSDAEDTKKAYGVNAFPTTFIIGGNGKVEWKGHPNDGALEKELQRVLQENPPKKSEGFGKDAGEADYKKAEKLLKKKQYAEALKAFRQIVKDYPDGAYSEKAQAQIKALEVDAKIMAKVREAEANKACEEWLDMARALGKQGKKKEAAEYYDKILKEYPESDCARTAQSERAKLKV